MAVESHRWIIIFINCQSPIELNHIHYEEKDSVQKFVIESDIPLKVVEKRDFHVTYSQWYSELQFKTKAKFENAQIVTMPYSSFLVPKRLVVFDMDSTLIEQEVIDEIAEMMNLKDQISAITHRAMNGEIDFKDSLKQRVALLKGCDMGVTEAAIKKRITFSNGSKALCEYLKQKGCYLVVISGGFMQFAEYVKQHLNLNEAYANILDIKENICTGELKGEIVDGLKKKDLVIEIAKRLGIEMSQVVAIGDGANDLWMLHEAGVGIAYNAKPLVQRKAPNCVNYDDMTILSQLINLE